MAIPKDGSKIIYSPDGEEFARNHVEADTRDRTRRIAVTKVLAAVWRATGHIFFPWGSHTRTWMDHKTLNDVALEEQNKQQD